MNTLSLPVWHGGIKNYLKPDSSIVKFAYIDMNKLMVGLNLERAAHLFNFLDHPDIASKVLFFLKEQSQCPPNSLIPMFEPIVAIWQTSSSRHAHFPSVFLSTYINRDLSVTVMTIVAYNFDHVFRFRKDSWKTSGSIVTLLAIPNSTG